MPGSPIIARVVAVQKKKPRPSREALLLPEISDDGATKPEPPPRCALPCFALLLLALLFFALTEGLHADQTPSEAPRPSYGTSRSRLNCTRSVPGHTHCNGRTHAGRCSCVAAPPPASPPPVAGPPPRHPRLQHQHGSIRAAQHSAQQTNKSRGGGGGGSR